LFTESNLLSENPVHEVLCNYLHTWTTLVKGTYCGGYFKWGTKVTMLSIWVVFLSYYWKCKNWTWL